MTLERIQVRRYEHAAGTPVVVLHGGPGAPGSAAGLARGLASDFSVLEPLQRRSGTVPLTVAQHVEDLAAVTPDSMAIVGHSWGAMLGLSFAARFPERLTRLALIGCGTYNEECRAIFRERLNGLHSPESREIVRRLRQLCAAETETQKRDAIVAQLGEADMKAESFDLIEDADEAELLPVDSAGNVETWQDVLRLQREGQEPNSFRRISCPVLMLHGAIDPHPGSETSALLRRFIPHLEYVEFADCGHEPWRERRARASFFETLREWLRSDLSLQAVRR